MDSNYQLELCAFLEKTALAELEEVKARERVYEIKYEAARYNMEMMRIAMKQQQEAQNAGQHQ